MSPKALAIDFASYRLLSIRPASISHSFCQESVTSFDTLAKLLKCTNHVANIKMSRAKCHRYPLIGPNTVNLPHKVKTQYLPL